MIKHTALILTHFAYTSMPPHFKWNITSQLPLGTTITRWRLLQSRRTTIHHTFLTVKSFVLSRASLPVTLLGCSTKRCIWQKVVPSSRICVQEKRKNLTILKGSVLRLLLHCVITFSIFISLTYMRFYPIKCFTK